MKTSTRRNPIPRASSVLKVSSDAGTIDLSDVLNLFELRSKNASNNRRSQSLHKILNRLELVNGPLAVTKEKECYLRPMRFG
jgi:hypothetical protein